MGLYDILKSAGNAAKEFNEEEQEAYEEAMDMSEDELRRKLKSSGSNARRAGYMKAAKQRGIR